MNVSLSREVVKRCPYRGENDVGWVRIELESDEAPELHDLGARIDELCTLAISHEAFTARVRDLLPGASVTTSWRTGPWDVVCHA